MDEELQRYRIEQAHAYLERIRKLGEDCAGLQQQVEDARERADGVKGIDYSAVRVQVSASDDAMANAVDTIKSCIVEYVTALAEYEDERSTASKSLSHMSDQTEAKALRLRYLLNYEWKDVKDKLNYKTLDGVMKLRSRALCSYWEVMPVAERDPMYSAI